MVQIPRDKLGASTDREAGEWVMRLCRAVRETVGADRVIVWLYDAPAQTVSPYATDSPDDAELVDALVRWAEMPLDSFPIACDVLLGARPAEAQEAQDDPRIPPELAADLLVDSIRFEPILAGRPIGMISVEPASAGARPELQTLVPVVAAGVGRVASRREADRERKATEFLLRLTEAAVATESIDELLATVCVRIARGIGARRATIILREGESMSVRATRNADGSYDSAVWERMLAAPVPVLAEAAVQAARPVIAREADSPLIPAAWAESPGISSAVGLPLRADEGVIGVLILDDPAPEKFSDEDVALAAAAAERIAPAIEQTLEIDERTSHLRAATAIRRLLEEGAGAASVEEAGEVLARVTRDALGAERATLLLQDEHEHIRHVISVGADGRFEELLREGIETTPAAEFRIWRLTTRQAKPIFVENARASRLIPAELVEKLDLKSYVALPLLSAGGPLGLVICSDSSEQRGWSNEERELVAQIALEGSLIVENAVLRAADQERLGRLRHQAFHDSLTKLPNRALFADRLQHALDRMSRRQESIAVLFLDLDAFKPINDTLGHEAGDRLLVSVGRRLQSCLRPEDTIARLGGDEFTVLLEDITDVRYAIRVAERIADSLKTPIKLDGHEASVTASIGIAVSTGRESTPDELLRNSDRAMYQAKYGGKARYVVYHDGMPAPEQPDDAEPYPERSEQPIEPRVVEHADALEEEPLVEEELPEPEPSPEPPPIAREARIIEGAGLFERTEPPGTEEEASDSVEPPGEDGGSDPGPALSEARRRRRLRFPPR
jgi:diguanylate cyclase (GGDEF)-like protein